MKKTVLIITELAKAQSLSEKMYKYLVHSGCPVLSYKDNVIKTEDVTWLFSTVEKETKTAELTQQYTEIDTVYSYVNRSNLSDMLMSWIGDSPFHYVYDPSFFKDIDEERAGLYQIEQHRLLTFFSEHPQFPTTIAYNLLTKEYYVPILIEKKKLERKLKHQQEHQPESPSWFQTEEEVKATIRSHAHERIQELQKQIEHQNALIQKHS